MRKVIAPAVVTAAVAITILTAGHHNNPAIEAYNPSNLYRHYTVTISTDEAQEATAKVEKENLKPTIKYIEKPLKWTI